MRCRWFWHGAPEVDAARLLGHSIRFFTFGLNVLHRYAALSLPIWKYLKRSPLVWTKRPVVRRLRKDGRIASRPLLPLRAAGDSPGLAYFPMRRENIQVAIFSESSPYACNGKKSILLTSTRSIASPRELLLHATKRLPTLIALILAGARGQHRGTSS